MNITTIIMEILPLAPDDIVINLFSLLYLTQFGALACDKSVHFVLIAVLFCAVANQVSHLT